MLIFVKGMKKIEKSAFSATYQTVWVAGPSINYVKKVRPLKEIMNSIVEGL